MGADTKMMRAENGYMKALSEGKNMVKSLERGEVLGPLRCRETPRPLKIGGCLLSVSLSDNTILRTTEADALFRHSVRLPVSSAVPGFVRLPVSLYTYAIFGSASLSAFLFHSSFFFLPFSVIWSRSLHSGLPFSLVCSHYRNYFFFVLLI